MRVLAESELRDFDILVRAMKRGVPRRARKGMVPRTAPEDHRSIAYAFGIKVADVKRLIKERAQ